MLFNFDSRFFIYMTYFKILQRCGYPKDEITNINRQFLLRFLAPFLNQQNADGIQVQDIIKMFKKAADIPEVKSIK